MHWITTLDGGPQRVNHAAVAIGDKIYSFGGYSSKDMYMNNCGVNELIDVHVLDTNTLRWLRIPSSLELEFHGFIKPRSRTAPGSSTSGVSSSSDQSMDPRPSSSTTPQRRHSEAFSGLHPLGQLRHVRPPLDFSQAIQHLENGGGFGALMNRPIFFQQDSPPHEERRNNVDIEAQLHHNGGSVNQQQNFRDIWAEVDDAADNMEMEFEDDDEDEEEETDDEMDAQPTDPFALFLRNLQHNCGAEDLVESQRNDNNKLHHFAGVPTQRYGHTVVAYEGCAYLWGGRNDKYGCCTLLHEYDPKTNKWRIVPTIGSPPPARDGHTAVVHNDRMYIFGGFEEPYHRFSHETYSYHFPTRQWTRVKTEGEPPQYRDFHAACVLNGKMYIFGGRSDESGQFHSGKDEYCDKLKALELSPKGSCHWMDVEVRGDKPCGRRSLTMWTYGGYLYIFGGYQSNLDRHFNDLFRWNPITSEWSMIQANGNPPTPRRRQCSVLVGSRVFIFGGTMPSTKRPNILEDLGDLHVLDFEPSLVTLALRTAIQNGVHKSEKSLQNLPKTLRNELMYLTLPSRLEKPFCGKFREFIGTG